MNEDAARQVLLVQAIETEDRAGAVLSPEDRLHASRSARELAQWEAAHAGLPAGFEQFLQQRSAQIVLRLAERNPSFATLLGRARLPAAALSALTVVGALLLGFGLDRIGNPHRVDLLSAPLLLILAWNAAAYAALLVIVIAGWRRRPREPRIGNLGRRWLALLQGRLPRRWPQPLLAGAGSFLAQWTRLGAPLAAARLARAWHAGAAAFALGAIASLYLRGVYTQYLAGWESTFLDAAQVYRLLHGLFAPVVAVFGAQSFSLADIEALRFDTGSVGGVPAPAMAASGARWVHLYAGTLLLFVVLPRLLLVASAHWQVRRWQRDFPLALDGPYFQRLRTAAGEPPGHLRVLPYSFTPDEARGRGLAAIAAMLLGEQARVLLRPAVPYGEGAETALRGVETQDAEVAITAVLFNLAATPEAENHGALLDHLQPLFPRGFMVLVDESAYLERLGTQAGVAGRLAQRVALWESFCVFHHCRATLVNLLQPALRPLELRPPAGPRSAA